MTCLKVTFELTLNYDPPIKAFTLGFSWTTTCCNGLVIMLGYEKTPVILFRLRVSITVDTNVAGSHNTLPQARKAFGWISNELLSTLFIS